MRQVGYLKQEAGQRKRGCRQTRERFWSLREEDRRQERVVIRNPAAGIGALANMDR